MRDKTTDPFNIWGQGDDIKHQSSGLAQKDRILEQERESKNLKNSSPYRRLKLVMDYWCSLWFWPINEAEQLPSRSQYFFDLNWLLMGGVLEPISEIGQTSDLYPDTLPQQLSLDFNDRFGQLDVDKIIRENPRLNIANRLVDTHRFFHWELEMADIFAERGGFDLILGNPPWLKVEWQEVGILGDANPLFVLRKTSASELNHLREDSFEQYPKLKADYYSEYEQAEGSQKFLNGFVNYSLLKGIQTNLFKCFLPQAWQAGNSGAVSGFLHPEGVYDDPKGGVLRAAIYPRLRGHYQFQNEVNLFSDVDHHAKFSINIYGQSSDVHFQHIANCFIPQTIDACYQHDGCGELGGIKNYQGKWNTAGHQNRIIQVKQKELQLFAKLYDSAGTPALQARLPALHSQQLVQVLEKFAAQPQRLGDLKGQHEPEPSSKITINKIYHPALRTYFLYIPLAIVGLFLVFFAVELWLFVLSMLGMKELPTWVDGGLLVIGTQIVGSTWVGRLMLIVLINYYGTALLIDSHGLTLKQGILTRDVTHIRFSEIRTIGLRQGILDRLLNIGILEFASSGTDDVDIRFINIANPTGVKAEIETIIEQQIQSQ